MNDFGIAFEVKGGTSESNENFVEVSFSFWAKAYALLRRVWMTVF